MLALPSRRISLLIQSLQALLGILIIIWAADVPSRLGIALYTEQFLAISLAIIIALVFLKIPARGGTRDSIPWYDLLIAGWGFLCCAYLAIAYSKLVDELSYQPLDGMIAATSILILTIEATRRTAGIALVIVVLTMCVYAFFGHLIPGEFGSRPVSLSRLVLYLGLDTNALFGLPLHVALIIVAPFILMGQILTMCNGGDYFTDLSTALMGRYRGGAAKIAVVGSALFGMISGSAVANVASVGVVTIPLMTRSGFRPEVAASIEAVGSTGGQLMPPVMGAAAFLMAEYLGIPYAAIAYAAIMPAVLYYAALFIQVDLEAAKLGISGAPLDHLPSAKKILIDGWIFPIPFVVLIAGLVIWNFQAEYAALMATIVLVILGMVFGYKGRRMTLRLLFSGIVNFGGSIVDIVIITTAAGLVIGVLNITGIAFGLTLQLLAASHESTFLLLVLTACIAIFLGMGMPTIGVYIVMATLAAPALIKAGIAPLNAHMFVMYFGMLSMVTPPVALAAFAAANIAQSNPWRTGWIASRIGWCAYIVPFLFAYSPALLLNGSATNISLSAATAIFGVFLGSVAAVGHLRRSIGILNRIAFAIVGVCLLVPIEMFPGALIVNIVAACFACALIAFEFRNPNGRSQRVTGAGRLAAKAGAPDIRCN